MKSKSFGIYGGQYAPETLMAPLKELEDAYEKLTEDETFWASYHDVLKHYVGRPTPLTFAKNLSTSLGGARIYLKREDLAHTGAHKINNCVGQILLAERLGKTRIVAETGAGQHGVATATVCALFGLKCVIYMGAKDMKRQAMNVYRMRLLGAEVRSVEHGAQTLKDATSEAIRDWVTHVRETHYLIGSVLGPHPYPRLVRDFQKVIGMEAKTQIVNREGRLPDHIVACVGGGSNALGIFHSFLEETNVKLTGVEAGGIGPKDGQHAARFRGGRVGVLHGCKTWVLQDDRGMTLPTHSISAGMDYPAIGPEHAWLQEKKRVDYQVVSDHEALNAFHVLSKKEGILPALESSHALAYAIKLAPQMPPQAVLLVNLSGRGDKDIETVRTYDETH